MAKAVQQLLQVGQILGRSLVGEPLLQGAVKALQLAERLGVVGTGVDELHPELAEGALEGDFGAVQASGETQPVVRQHLPGQPVAGGGLLEAVPGGIAGRAGGGVGGERSREWSSIVSST